MPTFSEWNERLKPFFVSGLRIIGEIPLSFSDIKEMGESLGKLLKPPMNLTEVTKAMNRHPYAFLCLLSGFASYNTNRDYWQSFADSIHLDKPLIYNQGWHKLYVKLAKQQGLRVFDFSEDPTPYVTSIRFQGGIPSYSLPDYFERMVLPAVERPNLREAPVKTVLDHLIKHVSFVDSPVLDFLEHSGDLGVEFFFESCRLARHAKENHGEILPLEKVNLPQYVVQAFETFLERKEDEKQHWHKPELVVAPYSEDSALHLFLPEQEISLDLSIKHLYWHVEWNGQKKAIEIPCKVYRQRQSLVTQNEYQQILETPNNISVSIYTVDEAIAGEIELRRWNLPLLPLENRAPLLAFRDNRKLVPFTLALPSEVLYLLSPIDTKLDFVGEARIVEECPPLNGAWQNWKIELMDLTKVWSIQVTRNGNPIGNVIPIQGSIALPELTGGHLFQFQEDQDLPLYTTELPALKIPVSNHNENYADLNAWQIRVRSLWEAMPCIDISFKLGQYHQQIEFKNERAILPLSAILGKTPAGTFEIELRGPRDIHSEFRFRFWSKALVLGHHLKLDPPSGDPKPSQFFLKLQENARCEPQAGADIVDITQNPAGWQITAPSELNRVLLDLTTPAENGGIVRVPIMIPLPKLRWALASETTQGTLELNQIVLQRSIDQLIQSGSSSLHVEMYGLGNLLASLRLRLVLLDDNETVIQEAKLGRTDFTKDWLRVTLGQFTDSIKSIDTLAQFELAYFENWGAEPIRIPLLELSRELKIDQVAFEQVNDTSWKITWQEEYPLKNRRVMILPAWQPWQKPWEYKIPDKAYGEFVINDIAIPPSRYHLYFYTTSKVSASREIPPVNINPFIIDLCTPQERINSLVEKGKSPNEQFKNIVEMANIHDSLGTFKQRDVSLSECAKFLIHLTNLDLLIASLKWMQGKDIDPPIKSFFFNHMFNIQIVERMLQTYTINDPALLEYLQYTGQVKNIQTDSAKLLLKRVDDPTIIYNCLHNLLPKKDDELPSIVVKMMADARFSKREAVELFSAEAAWAIIKIGEIDSNPYSDRIIAGLLPKVAGLMTIQSETRITEWRIRAIPYEKDGQMVKTYLQTLFSEKHPRAYELLMKCFNDELIYDEDVMDILSDDPKKSLQVLEKAPYQEAHQKWINHPIEKFPTIAGVIKPGDRLKTTFGEVLIDYIDERNNHRGTSARLGDPDCLLNVIVGDGADRFRLQIDYREMKIFIVDESIVWKCGQCGYIHPEQNKVMKHAKKEHRYLPLSFNSVTMPIPFTADTIEILF